MPDTPDALLAALDPEQRQVATSLGGPVCVLAGAGTGKTRAITHRIAYGVASGQVKPAQVLAVTFTQRAAGEMRGRLARLGATGVQARTFHSWALRQARYFWPKVYGSELPPILDRKFGLLARAASSQHTRLGQIEIRDLAGEIEWAKVSNTGPEEYAARAEATGRQVSGLEPTEIGRLFAAYEQVKLDEGVIDLEDVLLCAVALLSGDEKVAATVRAQYRHLVVDEYQDVSGVQQSLLNCWLGGRDDICVVGDPSQTIYSWAGADPANLVGFRHRFPSAEVVELNRDYRSVAPIVTVANQVLDGAGAGALPGRVHLRSQRTGAAATPTFTEYADEVAEARGVAAAIKDLHQSGTALRDVAVLFRVNAQSEQYEQALAEAGVATVLRGAERFFDRAEIKEARVRLRAAAGAQQLPLPGAVQDVLLAMGWSPTAPEGRGQARERWESLHALLTMAADHAGEHPDADLTAFTAELDRRADLQHAPVGDAVTLATLHSTKGLEWGCVFLVGMHEGTVPTPYATRPEQVEEERRLCYVGVTRAADRLAVSWSRTRQPGGKGRRGPTRFFDRVPAAQQARSDGAGRPGPNARSGRTRGKGVAHCRVCSAALTDAKARKLGRCLDCVGDVDEELFDALKAWRSEQAGEQKLPAYCIFTDATLTAIAEARPTTEAALLKLPGIGRAKLDKYADEVLAICAQD